MKDLKFGHESLDLRLLALYYLKNIRYFAYSLLLFAALFSGIYYFANFVFTDAPDYRSEAKLYIQYNEGVIENNEYYNFATWDTIAHTDEVINRSIELCGRNIPADEVRAAVKATVESDVRLLEVTVTDKNSENAELIAKGITGALWEFGSDSEIIKDIRVMTEPTRAKEVLGNDRTIHMAICGGVVGLLVALVGIGLYFIFDESVNIPKQFEERYGIPVIGAVNKNLRKAGSKTESYFFGTAERERKRKANWDAEALKLNFDEFTKGASKVAICDTSIGENTEYVMKILEDTLEKLIADENRKTDDGLITGNEARFAGSKFTYSKVTGINEDANVIEELKKYDMTILLVQAGDHNGKLIERALDYAQKHRIRIPAVILYDCDSMIMRKYMYSSRSKSAKRADNMKR